MNNPWRRLQELNGASSAPEYDGHARRWALRILAHTEAGQRYLRKGNEQDALTALIGYQRPEKPEKGPRLADWQQWLESALQQAESEELSRNLPLFENIVLLTESVGLSPVEGEVLAFRTLYRTNDALTELMERHLGLLSESKLARILGKAFAVPQSAVELAFRPESPLLSSGLLRLESALNNLVGKLAPPPGLLNNLLRPNRTLDELVDFAVRRPPGPALRRHDFPHHATDIDLLLKYLAAACRQGIHGVNVLLYGEPGVGKTELVRLIASELGLRLYEVNMISPGGMALTPAERYRAYLLNQQLFASHRDVLVIFDEIEDVFPARHVLRDRSQDPSQDKAWVNRQLENNPVPAFWVSNCIDQLDPAYLRRFDCLLELHNPPRSVRQSLSRRYFEGMAMGEGWVDRVAEQEHLTPAVIERAVRVLRHAEPEGGVRAEQGFERMIRNRLQASGVQVTSDYRLPGNYCLENLNVSHDLHALTSSLAQRERARILLHGAPGTGKTAFAHFLAKGLDRALHVRRASDLLSMWLGGTEQNLARMFREAENDRAVLLLDEADSFLQDRRGATHSWEITQVNELLTQMEGFGGILLCATNFLDHLDQASLRRFGLKVKFEYLRPEQAWTMFEMTLTKLGIALPDEVAQVRLRRELERLANLTPGDFAVASEGLDLMGNPETPQGLLDVLKQESEVKPDRGKRMMGFSA